MSAWGLTSTFTCGSGKKQGIGLWLLVSVTLEVISSHAMWTVYVGARLCYEVARSCSSGFIVSQMVSIQRLPETFSFTKTVLLLLLI